MEEKECIIRDNEKKLQKQHEGANMMRFDDNDVVELLRTMAVVLAKRRRSQGKGRERRCGMCGTEETKYPDHTFDKKSLVDAHPKDRFYSAGHYGRSSQETGDDQSGCDDQSCIYR